MKGWTLLAVCLGIFPPTDLFMKVSLQRTRCLYFIVIFSFKHIMTRLKQLDKVDTFKISEDSNIK